MSCDAVALAATLWLASTSATPPPAAPTPMLTPPSVASEPLFVDIVRRAGQLRAETKAYEAAPADGGVEKLKDFTSFETGISQLSDLDMQGHVQLVQRGYTDDLKCILKGISARPAGQAEGAGDGERSQGAPRCAGGHVLPAARQRRSHHRPAATGGLAAAASSALATSPDVSSWGSTFGAPPPAP